MGPGYQVTKRIGSLSHKPARPMKMVVDRDGTRWLCDKKVDEKENLEEQGCWRCGDLAFTRDD